MAILVECGCGVRKQVPDDWAGKTVTCKCGARIRVGSRRTEAVPPSLPEKPAGDVGAAPVILTNPSKGSRVARKKKTLSPLLVVGAAAAIFVVGIGILIAIFALGDARLNPTPVASNSKSRGTLPAGNEGKVSSPKLPSDAQSAATAAVEQAKRENARKLAQAEEDERQRKVQTSSDGNRNAPPSLNTAVVSEWTNVTDAPANPIRLAAPTAERHRASYFLPGAGHAKVVISVTKIREDSYHQLALIDLNTGTANAVFEPITTRRERTNNLYLSFHDGGHVLLDDQSRAPNHLFQAISAKTGKIVAETSPKIGVSNDFYANPSAGGDFVVANTTGQLWIWNIRANRVQPVDYPKLMAKFGSVRVVFSPNGRFGAFAVVMDEFNPTTRSRGYAAHLYTLDLASAQFVGHVAYTWNNREAQITGCQFSPQGNRIAVLIGPYGPNDPQCLVVFDAATGKPVTAIDPVPPPSRCYSNIPQMIAWGPDEQSLLVGMSHLTDLKSKTIRPLALPVKKPTSVVTRNIPIMLDIVPTDRPESWIGYVRETVPDTEHREELRAEVIAIAEQN